MLPRGVLFVRAQDPHGKWGSADFLDLTLESQVRFLAEILVRHQMVVTLKQENPAPIEPLRTSRPFGPED